MGGWRTVLLAIVSLATFLMIGGLSVRQIAAPSFALPALESGIAALSDVDRYLADHAGELSDTLDGTEVAELPGFPVDVLVTADDLSSDDGELRSRVLSRAAARVYEGGSAEFDQTGQQSLEFFSGERMLALLVNRLNGDTQRLAGWLAFVSALVLGAAASLLVLQLGRLPGIFGAAVLVGAAPGVGFAALFWLLTGLYGSGADPYAAEIRDILKAATSIPLRNFLVTAAAGGLIAASVLTTDLVLRRIPQAPDGDLDAASGDGAVSRS